jgi:hypothetical protein
MWLQVNANNELIGMPPLRRPVRVRVGLTARLPAAQPSELDGPFHGAVTCAISVQQKMAERTAAA